MCKIEIAGNKVIDLSHEFAPAIPKVGDFPEIKMETMFSHANGDLFNAELLTFCPHTSTHLDAPCHWVSGGKTLDELSADCLIGPAVIIDLRKKKGDAPIFAEDIKDWEAASGEEIRPGDAVLFWTDHDKFWGDSEVFLKGWPYMTEEGAKYLVSKKVRLIGMETLNIDSVNAPESPAHIELLGHEVLILENITNLDKIGRTRCQIVASALNIPGGTGCPVRVLAIV